MNLKKLFASSGVFALLAGLVLTPFSYANAEYNDEIKGAYDYAYSIDVTTMPSVETANPMGKAIRGHVAKMISNWALKTQNKKPNAEVNPVFTDLNLVDTEIKGYIMKSAQQGLMGQGITEFRPLDNVTRAEFGTLLSRALYDGKVSEDVVPYYKNNLETLKAAGIMNDLTNPERPVLRYEIWLMLKRAAGQTLPDADSDVNLEDMLACMIAGGTVEECTDELVDEDTTDEEDEDEEDEVVRKGDLDVSITDYSKTVKSAPSKGTVIFNEVKFAVSDDITIDNVTLKRVGLSNRSDVDGVWFEKDGVAVSSRASVNSDGEATVRFYRGFDIKSTEKLDLVVELDAPSGSEIGFEFADVDSTAKDVDFKGEQTTMYRTTTYQVATVKFDDQGGTGDVSYKLGERDVYEFGKFTLSNESIGGEDKTIVLKSLKLRNAGNADLNLVLKDVEITRDGKDVAKKVEMNGRDMIITFDDELDSGKKGIYTILAEIASLDRLEDSVQFELRKDTDVVAYEEDTNFRAISSSAGAKLKNYIIKGGKITLTSESNFPKVIEAGASSTDVVIAEGVLNIAEPIKLEKLKVKTTTSTGVMADVIKKLEVEIEGSTYTLEEQSANGEFFYEDDIYVSKKSDIRVIVSLKDTATNGNRVQFEGINGGSFLDGTYESNDEKFTPGSVIAGIIQIADLYVKKPTFSITNKSTTTQKVVKGNSDTVTLFDGEITTNKGKMSVNDLIIEPTSAGLLDATDAIYLNVYVNGEAFNTVTYKDGITLTVNNLGDVENDEVMKLKIDAQPVIASNTGTIYFNVKAEGTDENGNAAVATAAKTVKLEIVESAQINIANANASSSVVKEGSNSELVKFSTNVKNGAATMSGLSLSGDYSSITGETVTLEFDGNKLTTVVDANGKIAFTGLNENLTVGNHNFVLKTNIDTDGLTTGAVITTDSVAIDYVDAATAAEQDLFVKYMFVKAYPTLALVKNDNNELVVRITNPSDSDQTLKVVAFDANGTVNTASLNDQTISTGGTIDAAKQISLNAGDNTELKLGVANGTVQLKSITVEFTDGGTVYRYEISDEYTNVAAWGDLKVIYRD